MRKLTLLLPILGLALQTGCLTVKNTNLNELKKVVEMSKGPCFGQCPVFTLTVYDNGIAAYKGERFTDKKGLYIRDIGKPALEKLKSTLTGADLWKYPDAFKSQIPDLATVTLHYYEGDRTKTIIGKDGRPDDVMKIEEMLDDLANTGEWEQKEKPGSDLPAGTIGNELIVQLDGNIDGNAWVRQYAKQEMRVLKKLDIPGNFWLFFFNEDIIPPNEMLKWVRQDPDVHSAEFNKTLNSRN